MVEQILTTGVPRFSARCSTALDRCCVFVVSFFYNQLKTRRSSSKTIAICFVMLVQKPTCDILEVCLSWGNLKDPSSAGLWYSPFNE